MKNKGFTLVELLAVIVIMGILTIFAFPGIKYIKNKNEITKFDKYSSFVIEASKLYTESNSDDMFGFNGTGCYDINFSELETKGLLKDFNHHGTTCNNNDTFVRVEKNGNRYRYIPSIKCTNKNNDIIYEKKANRCNSSTSKKPSIKIDIENIGESNWTSKKKFVVSFHSDIGFIDNLSFKYGFNTNNKNLPSKMESHSFNNDYGVKDIKYEFIDDTSKEGLYYLYVDGVGVVNTEGFYGGDMWSMELTFDSLPPTKPKVVNKFYNKWYNENNLKSEPYVLNLSSIDYGCGIKYYRYRYPDSSNTWNIYNNSNKNEFTTTPFKTNRNERVEIQACDYLGNCSESEYSKIMLDTKGPNLTITNNHKNTWTNSNVTIKVDGNDNVSGTSAIYYGYNKSNVNGTDWNTITTNHVEGIWRGNFNSNVFIRAVDIAGNVSDGDAGKIQIDKNKPTLKVDNDHNGYWTRDNVKITVNGNDDSSGIKDFYYGYSRDNVNGIYWNYKSTNSAYGIWTDNTYTDVYVRVIDNAGNSSNVVSAGRIMIDNEKPTLTVNNNSNGYWTSGNVQITVNGSDSYSGIKNIYYGYSRGNVTATDWDSFSNGTAIGTWSASRNNEVFVKVVDNLGNESDIVSAGRIRIDKTKPVISGGIDCSVCGKCIINLSASDAYTSIAKWEWKYEGGGYNSWTDNDSNHATFNKTFTDKGKSVVVYAYDALGNYSEPYTATVNFSDCRPSENTGLQILRRLGYTPSKISEKPSSSFRTIATTNEGVFKTRDDDGTSYYFRGAVNNNFAKLGNDYYRIVRVNGDGTVRLIYSGKNLSNPDDDLLGFDYYDEHGADNWSRANYKTSNVKQVVDRWYNSLGYKNYLTSGKFCNDLSFDFGDNTYGPFRRLLVEKNPTLVCPNNLLVLNSGLITLDELAFAGGVARRPNSKLYLNNGRRYWTMSPERFTSAVKIWYLNADGDFYAGISSHQVYTRPVIILKSDLWVTGGNGTSSNPFTFKL